MEDIMNSIPDIYHFFLVHYYRVVGYALALRTRSTHFFFNFNYTTIILPAMHPIPFEHHFYTPIKQIALNQSAS